MVAATVPNCRAYDPAFAYELAVILDHGMRAHDGEAERRVLLHHRDERELRAALDAGGIEADIRQRHVSVREHAAARGAARCVLLGSGAILREVIAAARLLEADWDVVLARSGASPASRAGARGAATSSAAIGSIHGAAPTEPCRSMPARRGAHCRRDRLCRAYPQLIAAYVEGAFTALAPTASDAATRARRCAPSSRSTRHRSCSPRSPRLRPEARLRQARSPMRLRGTGSTRAMRRREPGEGGMRGETR